MAFGFLHRWFGKGRARPDVHVVLFTRSDCPLCDNAAAILERYRDRHGFVLETRDIAGAEELTREHGDWIPVVIIDGVVRFRGHVNEVLLRRILE